MNVGICPSLLALLLSANVTLLASQRQAYDEGKKLFKVQLIIFVKIQIFHHAVHQLGVVLGLKKRAQETKDEGPQIEYERWGPHLDI